MNNERTRNNFKLAKILIIEDNADHWMLIKNAMEQCLPEIKLVHADSPEQTLKLLQEWSIQEWELPKLILQDLYIPNREDGWQLINQIKAMASPCSRIPLILLSFSNDLVDIQEAYQCGVASYLIKPLNFPDWVNFFKELRTYWWETATLPPIQFSV